MVLFLKKKINKLLILKPDIIDNIGKDKELEKIKNEIDNENNNLIDIDILIDTDNFSISKENYLKRIYIILNEYKKSIQ